MSTVALSPRTRSFGGIPTAAILMSALVSLGFFSLQGELAAFDGRPTSLLVLDIAVGVLCGGARAAAAAAPGPGGARAGGAGRAVPGGDPGGDIGHPAGRAPMSAADRDRRSAWPGVAAHLVRALWRPDRRACRWVWWFLFVLVAHAALVGWGALTQARPRAARLAAGPGPPRRGGAGPAGRRGPGRRADPDRPGDARRARPPAVAARHLRGRAGVPPRRAARAARPRRRGGPRRRAPGARGAARGHRRCCARTTPTATARPAAAARRCADLPTGWSRSPGRPGRGHGCDDRVPRPGRRCRTRPARTAYRVVQEGLTNARKHAPGQPVEVLLDGRPGRRPAVDITNPLPASAPARPAMPRQRHRPDRAEPSGSSSPAAAGPRAHRAAASSGCPRRLPWPA